MNNRVYKYFFSEFSRYFFIVLFALVAIMWTIQAVNFLDLVTEDGHAFGIYTFLLFSFNSKNNNKTNTILFFNIFDDYD